MKLNSHPDTPIHITPHHLTLSPALREFVRSKLEKVSRFADEALLAEVVLRLEPDATGGKRFSASARLAMPGRDIHATATHRDLYTAIVRLVAKLSRRSRKRKTRLSRRRSIARSFRGGAATRFASSLHDRSDRLVRPPLPR